jgi:hypothetical protein
MPPGDYQKPAPLASFPSGPDRRHQVSLGGLCQFFNVEHCKFHNAVASS